MSNRPPARIPCGEIMRQPDGLENGKPVYRGELPICGKVYGEGINEPIFQEFCGECAQVLARLGLRVLNFRKAIKDRNEQMLSVTVKSTETLLREYGVIE